MECPLWLHAYAHGGVSSGALVASPRQCVVSPAEKSSAPASQTSLRRRVSSSCESSPHGRQPSPDGRWLSSLCSAPSQPSLLGWFQRRCPWRKQPWRRFQRRQPWRKPRWWLQRRQSRRRKPRRFQRRPQIIPFIKKERCAAALLLLCFGNRRDIPAKNKN